MMPYTDSPPNNKGALDQFIEVGAKVEKAIGAWMPHVKIGIEMVKYFVKKYNERQNVEQIELPPDAELIAQLEARANRIVATGEEFLKRP